jgi:predicted nuclease of predicted toxin-antitoxin system
MGWVNLIDLVRANPPTQKEIEQVLEYRRKKAKARFYADENFPARATEVLRSMGGRAITVQDSGHGGEPDENHAAYALKHGLILVTCDRDYLNENQFPLIHCPAIVVLDFGSGSLKEIRKTFTCLERVLASPQFFDKWVKIDAKRDSWIEYSRCLDGTTSRSRYRVYKGTIQEWIAQPRRT